MKNQSHTESPLVIGIGGGGSHLEKGSIVFRILATVIEKEGMDFVPVHGCAEDGAQVRVLAPSEQQQIVGDIVAAQPEQRPILLVGQCLGGMALMGYLAQQERENIQGAIFSPATRPAEVVNTSQSRARRRNNDTVMRIQRLKGDKYMHSIEVDHNIDALLPSAYLDEAGAATTHDTLEVMTDLVAADRLTVWATQDDWNQTSPKDIERMKVGSANRHGRLNIVPQAGHSLHLPGTYEADTGQRMAFQRTTVVKFAQAALGGLVFRTQNRT